MWWECEVAGVGSSMPLWWEYEVAGVGNSTPCGGSVKQLVWAASPWIVGV